MLLTPCTIYDGTNDWHDRSEFERGLIDIECSHKGGTKWVLTVVAYEFGPEKPGPHIEIRFLIPTFEHAEFRELFRHLTENKAITTLPDVVNLLDRLGAQDTTPKS
ncbi:hypothetical protein AB0395_40605 [Streptosporangium sp. NPDC051023]|uniref:hypothetical protein n=1 Tax=Streptosporangium sp. NPDC051023 TaxID=3155410 RepID=UPI00344EDEB9